MRVVEALCWPASLMPMSVNSAVHRQTGLVQTGFVAAWKAVGAARLLNAQIEAMAA